MNIDHRAADTNMFKKLVLSGNATNTYSRPYQGNARKRQAMPLQPLLTSTGFHAVFTYFDCFQIVAVCFIDEFSFRFCYFVLT